MEAAREGARRGVSVVEIPQGDPRFPRELTVVHDPPEVIYAIGDLSLLTKKRVSIIGSRMPSPYGRRIAFEAAQALASTGLVIVSGAARGLDACAHEGALAAEGGTIAIVGAGADVDYPRGNADLLRRIREKGLVLSEYKPGTEPRDYRFPARNRLIAALGSCLLVVEGRAKGGTANTAEWALRADGVVFGVPVHLGDPLSESPNLIIRDGGDIYLGPNDILLKLGMMPIADAAHPQPELARRVEAAREARARLTGAEATLFDLIGSSPLHVDALATQAAIDPGLLLAALSSLELQGLIKQLPGKHFALAS